MTKITLDRETFKALASDTRLDILKTLDGKNMGLNEIAKATNLNKATLHEHLTKLNGAGLIKRAEREGHKWVYYKLTWKGESLLHPENTRIVVLFTTTFIALAVGILQLVAYIKGTVMNLGYNIYTIGNDQLITKGAEAIHAYNSSNMQFDRAEFLASPGLPDALRDFIFRVKFHALPPVNNYGISLDKDLSVIRMAEDTTPLTTEGGSRFVVDKSQGMLQAVYQNPMFLYIAIGCFLVFSIVLCFALWRLWENKTPKI